MSLNQSMNIALGSMQNNQYALTVVAQNIANLNTDGYHRKRVDFQERQYTTDCNGVISTIRGMNGASIASLTGFVDDAAFKDLIDKNADASYYNKLNDLLGGLEDISNDLGQDGLGALLNDFYVAASNLEKYPTDMAIRQQFLAAADTVCEKFNYIAGKYDQFKEDQYQTVQAQTNIVNSLLADLAEANKAHISSGQSDSTKCTIDNILAELSDYVNVSTEVNNNGTYTFYIGDTAVVKGTSVQYTLNAELDPESTDQSLKFSLVSTEDPTKVIENGVGDAISSGSFKAYVETLNGTGGKYLNVNDMMVSLDKAASAFAKALNDIQTYDDGTIFAASITADEETGDPILQKADPDIKLLVAGDDSDTITASNIKVNSEMFKDPFKVAAARIDSSKYDDDSWKKAVGNSDNAAEFSALRNAKIITWDNGVNCTLSEYLTNQAAKSGMDAASINSKAGTYQDIADSAAANYSNLIGVNLDEELADMIRYQRSYEASARIFAAINSIMDSIIAMV